MENEKALCRTRVGCLARSCSVCVCHCCVTVSSFVIQHCFRPCLSTALNAYGTNASPAGLCARTHTNDTFSFWCGWSWSRVGRATTVDAATCVGTHGWAKHNRKASNGSVFFVLPINEYSWADCACPQQQRAGRVLRHAAGGVVRPILLLLMWGRRSTRRSAVDVEHSSSSSGGTCHNAILFSST